jgi:hypothetical protein
VVSAGYINADVYAHEMHWLVAKLLLRYTEEGDIDEICIIIVIWAWMVGE